MPAAFAACAHPLRFHRGLLQPAPPDRHRAYGVADATEALVEEYKRPCGQDRLRRRRQPHQGGHRLRTWQGPLAREPRAPRGTNGTEYVFATKNIPATPVADLLPDVLAGVITAVKWPHAPAAGARISRVLRAPGALDRGACSMTSSCPSASPASRVRLTSPRGHRVLAPGKHMVDTAANLLDVSPRPPT